MNKKTVLLTIEALLCVITAAVLIVLDLSIYMKGLAARAENPMANIYTAEAIADKAVFVLPLFVLIALVTILSTFLSVRDDNQDKAATGIDIGKNVANTGADNITNKVRLTVLALAIIFIIIDIFNGSMSDVLIKASKICTECIGLG
jgi:hypothetical protein